MMSSMKKSLSCVCVALCLSVTPAGADESGFGERLLVMEQEDQRVRQFSGEPSKAELDELDKVDRANVAQIKKQLAKHGWSITDKLNKAQLDALFLILIHATFDPALQTDALDHLKTLVANKRIKGQYFALLTDKILIGQGKKQRYGSQFNIIDGEVVFKPIEDPEKVDELRQALQMPTVDFYKKVIEQLKGIKDHGIEF